MVTVNKFCFCLSLEVATKAIGILSVLTSMCATVIFATPAVMLSRSSIPRTTRVFYWAMTGHFILKFLASFLLLYGVFKRKPKLLWPWAVLTASAALILMTLCFIGAILAVRVSRTVFEETNVMISFYFGYAVLLLYLAVVVNSWRLELQRRISYGSVKVIMTQLRTRDNA